MIEALVLAAMGEFLIALAPLALTYMAIFQDEW